MVNKYPQRKRTRLKGHDYSQAGYYFVTICTQHRQNILCEIVGNDALVVPLSHVVPIVFPTVIGENVIECWNNIQYQNKDIELDEYCIMPDHFHGIIIIKNALAVPVIKGRYGFELMEHQTDVIDLLSDDDEKQENKTERRGDEQNPERQDKEPERRGRRSLQGLIKDFKSVTTRLYNKTVDIELKNTLWQSSYHDEIIRNETTLNQIRKYIKNNPMAWTLKKPAPCVSEH